MYIHYKIFISQQQDLLWIPDSYDAKIAKKSANMSVIQLVNHLFKIRQKTFLPNDP